jgi:AcrR family transcriptional regulator
VSDVTDLEQGNDVSENRMRVDARLNRRRILLAAYKVFSEYGVDAQMTDIAEASGVGIGTLYRNFESKEALVNALVEDRLRQSYRGAEIAALADDPWEALVGMIRWITEQQLENQILSQFLAGRIAGSPDLQKRRDDLYELLGDLVKRASRAGDLRSDVGTSDIRMVMMSICNIATTDDPIARRLVVRYLGIVIDGLRSPAQSKLEGRPLTIPESEAAFANTTGSGNAGKQALRRGRRTWPT